MGIYQYTADRIRQLCAERGITPNALSYAAGISQSTVKSILNGESKNPRHCDAQKNLRRAGHYADRIFRYR